MRASKDGEYYLNVFARTRGANKAASVPVTVGKPAPAPANARTVATPDGGSVIEMPARQIVH